MTVENLEINVKTNVSGSSAKTITSLADALGKLEAKASSLSGLSNLTALANAMASISGASVKASAFSGITKGIENLSAALKTISSDDIARLASISNALRNLNNVNLNGLGNASNISRAANSLHQTARAVDDVAKSAKKADGPISNFISSLKRIAFYRIIRSVIKAITQAFKEGLENAYEYSKAVGGDLAPALDRIATASAQMKNQLGAALGGLLVQLEPLITGLIHLITKLAQAFTWLIAVLSGEDQYLVANEVATSWKEADKAAKDYKKTILGFDVINRLNDPNSGGGSAAKNYADLFHYEPTGLGKIGGWFETLLDKILPINISLSGLKDLLTELVANSPYQVEFGLKIGESVKLGLHDLKTQLEGVFAKSPYLITIGAALAPATSKVFSWVKARIAELMKPSPYTVGVAVETVPSFSAVLSGIWERIRELQAQSPVIISTVLEKVPSFAPTFNDVLEHLRKMAGLSPVILGVALSTLPSFGTVYETVLEHIRKMMGMSPVVLNVGLEILPTFRSAFSWVMDRVKELLSKSPVILEVGMKQAGSTTTTNNGFSHSSGSFELAPSPSVGDIPPMESVIPNEERQKIEAATKDVVADIGKVVGTAALAGAAIWAASQVTTVESSRATAGASGGSFGNRLADLLYASGGFPEAGELFIARERGPELVGNINGRTAVANNDQIVEGIKAGVYDAVTAAMGNGNERPVSVKVYLDSREIRTGQQRLARTTGY